MAGIKPYRRVLLLVNPVSGKGKAKAVVKETVIPILEAAGCVLDVRGEFLSTDRGSMLNFAETTHHLNAEEIAREVDLVYE